MPSTASGPSCQLSTPQRAEGRLCCVRCPYSASLPFPTVDSQSACICPDLAKAGQTIGPRSGRPPFQNCAGENSSRATGFGQPEQRLANLLERHLVPVGYLELPG